MLKTIEKNISESTVCFHCGDVCSSPVLSGDKLFCCNGCKSVYEILNDNNLCSYYQFNNSPGNKANNVAGKRFEFLDDESTQRRLIDFKNQTETHITFSIPTMHCSSCIWLLENFKKVNDGIITSRVNFIKKELFLVFNHQSTSLRVLVEQLHNIGYEPSINLSTLEKKVIKAENKNRIIRIGIAGFCFGNIMMLSFPEYFSSGQTIDNSLKLFFNYLNLALSIPVFFYSASEFFIKSYRSIVNRQPSIDLPIALGIAAIFLRSFWEITTQSGSGYLDSGSGLIFFMLIGRWFQDFTFDALRFDRDYKSYFPVSVTTVKRNQEREVLLNDLRINDTILIRHNEIIPVDGILCKGEACIDYGFVTGESLPVMQTIGEGIFAGGRQTGGIIEIIVTKELSQSYLTQLWSRNFSSVAKSRFSLLVEAISKWFIVVTFCIACIAAAWWWKTDIHKAINAFTAVLVIACPCALALSAPFAHGNMLRILGRNKIFMRDASVIEKLADINEIVFDKTGTLTSVSSSVIIFNGNKLSAYEESLVYSLARHSSHPLSKLLASHLYTSEKLHVENFTEVKGAGVSGIIKGNTVKLGTLDFVNASTQSEKTKTLVAVNINGQVKGYYTFSNQYRAQLNKLAEELHLRKLPITVLTGDNDSERENLQRIFGSEVKLKFNQTPDDKLNYIKNLQYLNKNVLMVGDGLNDAGALLQSNVGISITDNTNAFTPGSDVIMDSSKLILMQKLIRYADAATKIIVISFVISLLYNLIGLSFAVTGSLSPLTAAILMPISTISLVLFTVIASSIKGRLLKFL